MNDTNKLKKQPRRQTYLFRPSLNNELSLLEISNQSIYVDIEDNPIITEFIEKIQEYARNQRETDRELLKLFLLDYFASQAENMPAKKSTLMYEPNALNKSDIFSNESLKARMSMYEKRLACLRQEQIILERLGNMLQDDDADISTSVENSNEYSYVSAFNEERTDLIRMNDFNLDSLKRWWVL